MLAVVTNSGAGLAAGASHPAVAVWFALGAAGLAAMVVAMAWSVHARQIRLAELMVRRQFLVIAETGAADRALDEGADPELEAGGDSRTRAAPPALIEGPD